MIVAKQNIFDNETFFEGYRKLREREVNSNNLFEIPTLYALLPDLEGRKVLDLGCGSGERCIDYIKEHPQWRLSLQTHKLIGFK